MSDYVIISKERGTTLLKRNCKITFISHGETINTQELRISDSEKYPPLTEAGQEEVEKICNYLKKRGVKNDKIYTSPALRCIQTVEPITKVFKQEFEILNNLYIRKCGPLNGKTFEAVAKQYSDDFPTIANIDVEGCEFLGDFNKRVYDEIMKLVDKSTSSRIIVVTYPMVIQSIVAQVLDVPKESQYKILIKSGSLTQIIFFENWASLIYSDVKPL